MDSPPAIRGQFYSTHLTARCPNYHQCKRCLMCQNYNRHNPLCTYCEAYKPGGRHHECTPAQQLNVMILEERFNAPRFNINAEAKDVTVDLCTTSFNSENATLIDSMHAAELEAQEIQKR